MSFWTLLKVTWPSLDTFLNLKNICLEISESDLYELVGEARLYWYVIQVIRKEYMPFLTSTQGWTNVPTIVKLENLLTNQKAFAMQMMDV